MKAQPASWSGLAVGDCVGPYRIIDELGGGGMGMVYVAEHALLGRRAALKVMRPEYGHQPDVVRRFFNEARATTAIRHPGIVEIYDFGYTEDGHAYIVMELLRGLTLADRLLAARRLPTSHALVLVRRIAAALAAAHGCGVVHRDLKPDNIFLVADPEGGAVEQVKLLDFGIAKLADGGDAGLTRTGMVIGTPLYMSPEQCRGAGGCDHRSDLYSLGCVLFEMVSGRPPFLGEGVGEILSAHQTVIAPDVRRFEPAVSLALASLIARMLAKDRNARPGSAGELVATCDQLIAAITRAEAVAAAAPVSHRWGRTALIAGGVAFATLGALLLRTATRVGGGAPPAPVAVGVDAGIAVGSYPHPLDAGVAIADAGPRPRPTVDSDTAVTRELDAAAVSQPRRRRAARRDHDAGVATPVDDINTPVPADDIDTPVP